jgi:hypothetical protein
MRRLLFLSTISGAATGCGDDCGPKGAPDDGLLASANGVVITYGHLRSSANNDCPGQPPSDVISLTITGVQTDGTGMLTLCIPRIDLLDGTSGVLGTNQSTADIRIVDAGGTSNSCTLTFNSSLPPTGTGIAAGVCKAGTSSAGFSLELDGAMSLNRTCPTGVDQVSVTLRGKVAVTPQ